MQDKFLLVINSYLYFKSRSDKQIDQPGERSESGELNEIKIQNSGLNENPSLLTKLLSAK